MKARTKAHHLNCAYFHIQKLLEFKNPNLVLYSPRLIIEAAADEENIVIDPCEECGMPVNNANDEVVHCKECLRG